MHRRRFLRAVGTTGLAGGLAGCLGGDDDGTSSREATTAATGESPAGTPTPGADLPVPESELTRGASKDAIPAITEPEFGEDWSGIEVEARNSFGEIYTAEPRLERGDRVIGVARDGEARAYPLKVLTWHEIVNDSFGGPLLVTYCPLCGSAVTAERTVDGEPTVFGVSGYLWRSDLVMYDEPTESLWSQILARSIRGDHVGDRLTLVPSSLTTLDDWRDAHPDTKVLRPPPESGTVVGRVSRDYGRNPYFGYEDSERVGLGNNEFDDRRLHPKTTVIGVSHQGVARAYPLPVLQRERVVNDDVGGLPVVVAVGAGDTLAAYVRGVDGEIVEFSADGGGTMRGGGSTWEIATGRAIDGPHAGATLERATDRSPMFWFAWAEFNEETDVYGRG